MPHNDCLLLKAKAYCIARKQKRFEYKVIQTFGTSFGPKTR